MEKRKRQREDHPVDPEQTASANVSTKAAGAPAVDDLFDIDKLAEDGYAREYVPRLAEYRQFSNGGGAYGGSRFGDGGQRPPSRRNAPLDFSDDTKLHFPYKANFNDHFETSVEALQDLMPVIDAFRALVRPNCPERFTLYDPYYCAGAIRGHWKALGIENFIHEKRDFYADIREQTVPSGFDMLVTNPPYSDDHIERLLDFLIGSNKAFAFLVPDYVASKDWYVKLIETCYTPNELTFRGQSAFAAGKGAVTGPSRHQTATAKRTAAAPPPMPPWLLHTAPAATSDVSDSGSGVGGSTSASTRAAAAAPFALPPVSHTVGVEPFYVVPRVRYDFRHPLGVGHDASHFKSMWFVWCGRRTNEVIRAASCAMAKMENGPKILSGLAELRDAQVIRSDVRKNPKQRAREQRSSRGGHK